MDIFDKPKSVSLIWPWSVINMLSGFRSLKRTQNKQFAEIHITLRQYYFFNLLPILLLASALLFAAAYKTIQVKSMLLYLKNYFKDIFYTVAMSSTNGLVGTGFASRYCL